MRTFRLAAPSTLTVLMPGLVLGLVLGASACEDGASPTVDTSIELPDGGIEPTAPFGSDPQMTPAPNPNAGAGGGAPAPRAGSVAP